MSILRKIPKIEQVLDNMSLESLKRLESLMNSGNGATETYTLFGGENKLNYENKDLGVWYCNIELERNRSVETGFLIWESETKALFVSFDITQCLKEYEIDLTNYTFVLINEKLSIEEFRRVLEDNINKEVVHIDTSGNVEVGKNLIVDGKVILNGKEDLVDTSGNELISGGGSGAINLDDYINGETLTLKSEELYGELITRVITNKEIFGYLTFGEQTVFFTLYTFNGTLMLQGMINLGFEQLILLKCPVVGTGLQIEVSPYGIPLIDLANPISTPRIVSYDNNTQSDLAIGDGLVIENGVLKAAVSNKIWFDVASLGDYYLTEEQYNTLVSYSKQGLLAGINNGGFFIPLQNISDIKSDKPTLTFEGWYLSIGLITITINGEDRKVNFNTKSVLISPTTSPSSQVIPSITTSNTQQNLTIGDGLEIKDGALQEKVLNVSVSMTAEQLSLSINNSGIETKYTEENKAIVFDFIKAQCGIMRLTVNTPIGNLCMTLRPSLWKDDTNHSYDFEGNLYLETDLSAIGAKYFNQIIVRAICWDTDNSVSFRPTIIPIGDN